MLICRGAMMQVMQTVDLELKPPVSQPSARRRRWIRLLAALVYVAALGGAAVWWVVRPPTPVAVADAVHRFRSTELSGTAHRGGPDIGVYVYATDGWERVSSANITHHYPARTTLTVTDTTCGLRIRWDGLAGRWAQWDLCRTASGWHLEHYVDAHKFLYVQDIHEYTCAGFPVVVCRAATGILTSTVEPVSPGHMRITQIATGRSISTGNIEVWLLPNGLPQRLVITDHGSQSTLGQRIEYTESATFTLTSATPLR